MSCGNGDEYNPSSTPFFSGVERRVVALRRECLVWKTRDDRWGSRGDPPDTTLASVARRGTGNNCAFLGHQRRRPSKPVWDGLK